MKTKKNLITALKKLVTSFGGEAKSNNTVDLVDEFADIAAQGGGGSGSEVFVVPFTFDNEDNVTTEISVADISAASYTKPVIAIAVNGDEIHQFCLHSAGDEPVFSNSFGSIFYDERESKWILHK